MTDGAEELIAELTRQLDVMRGRVETLTEAIVDVERVAEDCMDLGRSDLASILRACQKRSVVAAMAK